MENLLYLLLSLPVLVPAFAWHEWAHAVTADRLGDPTPREHGRLSLDPSKQLDIGFLILMGTIALGFPAFGWASVPINREKLRDPKRDNILVSLAGPFSNLVMAFFWFLMLLVLRLVAARSGGLSSQNIEDIVNVWPVIKQFQTAPILVLVMTVCSIGITKNILLAVFNLLPIPPLDGSHVLAEWVPSLQPIFRQMGMGFLVLPFLLGALPPVQDGFHWIGNVGQAFTLRALGEDPQDWIESP